MVETEGFWKLIQSQKRQYSSSTATLEIVEPMLSWHCYHLSEVPFRLVHSSHRLSHQGNVTDDSAEVFFQSFLQEALVSSSGIDRNIHCLMLSIQHLLCQPRHRPPCKVPWRMIWERLSWRVTCPNHASFRSIDMLSVLHKLNIYVRNYLQMHSLTPGLVRVMMVLHR